MRIYLKRTLHCGLSTLRDLALIASLLSLAACDKLFETAQPEVAVTQENKLNAERLLSATNLYAYSQVSEALNQAQILDGVITTFLHHPNPASIEATQKAWKDAYTAYLNVSFFHAIPRFEQPKYYKDNTTYKILHEQLDSWPIEAGYIDYLPSYPLSGIVNDMTLKISAQSMIEQHGFSDVRFASIGFHPLEFLLFGMDGQRSARDFIPQENSIEIVHTDTKEEHTDNASAEPPIQTTEAEAPSEQAVSINPQNHNRRREYLRLLSALLLKNLQTLADRWEPAHGYYAKQWRQPQRIENLTSIYQVSVNVLQNEILNRHLQPLINQTEPEDLRSPFAAQDRINIQIILQSIENLFYIENGFISEMKSRHAESADKITAQFKRLMRATKKLPSNLIQQPLAKRQKLLAPIQQKIITLLEQLYAGAEILELPLNALPVSTN